MQAGFIKTSGVNNLAISLNILKAHNFQPKMSTYGHLFIHAWAEQIIIGLFFVALFINMEKPNVPQ